MAVLTTYMNYEVPDAEVIAARLGGFGPNMYSRKAVAWVGLLGDEDGYGVYNLLMTLRHKKGAVPKGLEFRHWKG